MKLVLRSAALVCLLVVLTSCGFHLRGTNSDGASSYQFSNVFIQGNTLIISKNLKQSLTTNGVKVLPAAEGAELLLETVGEENEKRILSLAGSGTVNEFELFYRVRYRTKFSGSDLWSAVQTVEARRDFTYSDANLLAKQGEEKRLNENMQADVLSNMMRRLSRLKK